MPRRRSNRCKTSPTTLAARKRQEQCVALRIKGLDLKEIAERVGCSTTTVYKDTKKALLCTEASIADKAQEWREINLKRYEKIIKAHFEAATEGQTIEIDGEKHAIPPSTKSADIVLKTIKQQVELMGLGSGPSHHNEAVHLIMPLVVMVRTLLMKELLDESPDKYQRIMDGIVSTLQLEGDQVEVVG